MHRAAKIVHRDVDFRQVLIDIEIPHCIGGALPVGDEDAIEACPEQGLDQALALGIVGDRRAVPGIGRVDEDRRARCSGLREIPEAHGIEIEDDAVGGCPFGRRWCADLPNLGDEFQIVFETP